MILSSLTFFLLTWTSAAAFSPLATNCYIGRHPTFVLKADTLEGWKVQGDLRPVNDYILVKVADVQNKTDGGVLLSVKATIKKNQGIVVSMGPGKYNKDSGILHPMPVVAGEEVMYGKYDGTELLIDGIQHNLIRDENILVKFNAPNGKVTLNNVQAFHDSVLIEMEDVDFCTSSGLIMTGTSSTNDTWPSTGVVRKIGPGRMAENGNMMAMVLKEGDMVKFRYYGGTDIKIDSLEYVVVPMYDILAKF